MSHYCLFDFLFLLQFVVVEIERVAYQCTGNMCCTCTIALSSTTLTPGGLLCMNL